MAITGINVDGKRLWIHKVSNECWPLIAPHAKRGNVAMDTMAILSHFSGLLMYDHWQPYYRYENCAHVLCNAHHKHELTRAYEQDGQAAICLRLKAKSGGANTGNSSLKRMLNAHHRKQARQRRKHEDVLLAVNPAIYWGGLVTPSGLPRASCARVNARVVSWQSGDVVMAQATGFRAYRFKSLTSI